MGRNLLMLVGLAAIAFVVLQTCGGEPVTRGEVSDRNAAAETRRCAGQYLRDGQSRQDRADIWRMCLDTVAETTGRAPQDIRKHIRELR